MNKNIWPTDHEEALDPFFVLRLGVKEMAFLGYGLAVKVDTCTMSVRSSLSSHSNLFRASLSKVVSTSWQQASLRSGNSEVVGMVFGPLAKALLVSVGSVCVMVHR